MKKGFTFIEIMVIVGIIGLLASIMLVLWAVSAQNKGAITSYKKSMDSLRAAIQVCVESPNALSSGLAGTSICGEEASYPEIAKKCSNDQAFFQLSGTREAWSVRITKGAGGSDWDCKGCQLVCNTGTCTEVSGPGTCK